jgi:hypothetical protein
MVRGDLSQSAHIEGLPLGTRGGVLARHTFPLDGQYVIKAELLQTNLGAVRGLVEPHDIEFSVDGTRVFQASVGGDADNAMSAANAADIIKALDERLTTRVPITAGPHGWPPRSSSGPRRKAVRGCSRFSEPLSTQATIPASRTSQA